MFRSIWKRPTVLSIGVVGFLTLAGCSTLEVPFRYLGLRRQPLRVVSDTALPRDVALDRTLWSEPVEGQSLSGASVVSFASATPRNDLFTALEHSIDYLQSRRASSDYRRQSTPQFHPDAVLASLLHFRTVLLTSRDTAEFEQRVRRDFMFFRSIGAGTKGKVLFTAYCQPEFDASLVPTSDYRFPLFRRPASFSTWPAPHPKRVALEGKDGLGGKGTLLEGDELVFLRSRHDALFIQIQGSALLRLTDGAFGAIGFDGATNYPFTSVARLMIRDGALTRDRANANDIRRFASQSPDAFDRYVAANNRFVFFRFMSDARPRGSIGLPVTQGRSIATDKALLPPGALAIARTALPSGRELLSGSRFVLDQDTGSAIKGPGRVDFFNGSGNEACEIAGRTQSYGDLYYLLLRDPAVELAYLNDLRNRLARELG